MSSKGQAGGLSGLKNNTNPQWWKDPGLRKLHAMILCSYSCAIVSGFDNSLINNLQSLPTFLSDLKNPNASTLGLIGAFGTIGSLFSTVPAAWLGERFGRLNAMSVGGVISIAGILIQAFSQSPIQYAASRFIVSFGNTCALVYGATLTLELSHPRYRSTISLSSNVSWYLGSFVVSWLCYGLKRAINSDWQWKGPTLAQLVPAVFIICLRFYVPESPRWLMSVGREDEAIDFLYKYHANGDRDDEMVRAEISEIRETLRMEKEVQSGVTWKDCFNTKGNRRRMFITFLWGTCLSWTGQSIVSYYNSAILKQAGVTSPLNQLAINGGLSMWDFFTALAGAIMSTWMGRRKMLFISYGGMLCAHIVVTALAATYSKTHHAGTGYAVIAFVWLESGFYNLAVNPLTYVYVAEIMNFGMRGKGVAFFFVVSDCWGIVTRYCNPLGLANIGYWYYVFFCFVYVVEIAVIYSFFPETQGRTLEEIGDIFDGTDVKAATEMQLDEAPGHEKEKGDLSIVSLSQVGHSI